MRTPLKTLHIAAKQFHSILPKHRLVWGALWLIWALALWFLSAGNPATEGPNIPHLDKVLHFTYFGIGGSLWTGYFLLSHHKLTPLKITLLSWCMGACIGALDEYHQSFTPGRNGNDLFDWCADHLGALCGALLSIWIFRSARNSI